uniref:C2 domain-containing protein / protein kinase-related n=1 Tax=Musa acuminata TaxID=4641 RepID=Q1ENY2_MUSAC|nr:C2 domain-containing protein / protein kinase-related [Musa acuminata]
MEISSVHTDTEGLRTFLPPILTEAQDQLALLAFSLSLVMSIQGQLLEVTALFLLWTGTFAPYPVVGCNKLKDTEWISRQDPYVILEYATTKFRTRTSRDGGRNPSFQEKTALSLIEGLREISVSVWNKNTVSHDDFIGSGRVQLSKVLAQGYDDSCWSIQSRSGRYSGEVKLIMHYANAGKAEVIVILFSALIS